MGLTYIDIEIVKAHKKMLEYQLFIAEKKVRSINSPLATAWLNTVSLEESLPTLIKAYKLAQENGLLDENELDNKDQKYLLEAPELIKNSIKEVSAHVGDITLLLSNVKKESE